MKKIMFMFITVLFFAVLTVLLSVPLSSQARADIITLDPGRDTRLLAYYPNQMEGAYVELAVYHLGSINNLQHSLLYFDLSSIPGGQVVTAASLELHVEGLLTNASGTASPLYRLTRDWTESVVTGATWNTYDGTNAWTTLGGDFNPQVYASSVPATGTLANRAAVTWDATTLVQQWYAGTYPNFGMLLDGAEGNWWHFSSKEDPADSYAYRPQLSVTYSPATSQVPEPSTLTLLGAGLGAWVGAWVAARRRKKS